MDHLKINKDKLLGRGSFGKVYYGTYFRMPVAIKSISKKSINAKAMQDFKNEVEILM